MNKKTKLYLVVTAVLIISAFIAIKIKPRANSDEQLKQISPVIGSIQAVISTTGIVLPKNRLEIKPPVNGRIENILVKEGESVEIGQTLAWMSSTERAALIDAARSESEEKLKYWQGVYKPIALMAPINGEVIVATTQPGQTVTASDAVIVLSDHLIVRAQVDETDIGKITADKKAIVSLDAYPDTKINASVEHIYYESKTVNNVTVYEIDLTLEKLPPFLRSGMNASIDFIAQSRENALLIPVEAVYKEKEGAFCFVKQKNAKEPIKTQITPGISDDKNVEIISGITPDDIIMVKTKKYALPKNTAGTNPFLPGRRR